MTPKQSAQTTDDEVFEPNQFAKASDHQKLIEKVNTLFTVEGFAEVFCDKLSKSIEIKNKLCEIVVHLIKKDDTVKEAITKIILDIDNRNFWATLWKFGLLVGGAIIFIAGVLTQAFISKFIHP